MSQPATRAALDALWRIESARIVSALARLTGDVATAEDLAQEALVAALEQWTEQGIPRNPGAWLLTVARRRAMDRFRREDARRRAYTQVAAVSRSWEDPVDDVLDGLAEPIDDDVLRLVFICCHPVLPLEGQMALSLRLLGGLTTREIARAFLVSETTMGQRISRAKRTLSSAQVAFEVPDAALRPARLTGVLGVVYLIFNEGYTATTGTQWARPDLCEEALRLGRMLAALTPNEPEVHALAALMELQASRIPARVDASGAPVLLPEQDRTRWDRLLIQRGLAALARAQQPGHTGPYLLQAQIAACHATASTAQETNWAHIAALYDELAAVQPSPVVELNRAVAHAQAYGPQVGLALLDPLLAEKSMASYHLLHGVRAELLSRTGRWAEAAQEYGRAASLTANEVERTMMLARADAAHANASRTP